MNSQNPRSSQQLEMFKLNLIIGGAIMAFALKSENEFMYALLIIPIVSFILFLNWVHQALVIRLSDRNYEPSILRFPELIRRVTIFCAIAGNFCGMSVVAVLLYFKITGHCKYSWLLITDLVLLILMFVFLFLWLFLQYSKSFAKKYKSR